jgi:RNA polymerase sigma-70 factor (ECF subfamily)
MTADGEDYSPLLARIRSGDEQALHELVARAEGIARRYSAAVCGDAPDRDDAMQEALLKTFRHAAGIEEPRAFRAWLYRVVKNACLVGRRVPGGAPALPLDEDAGPAQAGDPAVRLDAGLDLQRAIAALPPSYREAVFLRDVEGLSTREVADVLGLTEANVKVRLHRAHQRMRRLFTPRPAARGGRRGSSRRTRTP